MIERFQGEQGRARLTEAFRAQRIVQGNEKVAKVLADLTVLREIQAGEELIRQDAHDNELFFLLSGEVAIIVNGREVARRKHGWSVGEMALIDPAARRSATVVATEVTVVAIITEANFTALTEKHGYLWRRLAVELAARLRDRNRLVRALNEQPVLFIASSIESLEIARQIQLGLSHDAVVPKIWTDNVFIPGHGTMEDLEVAVEAADFGIIVCGPDDIVISRAKEIPAPRDNVVLELGMCLGELGRKRTFLVLPRNQDLKIPTDVLGINPVDYEATDPKNLAAHVGSACTRIRNVVKDLGPK